MTFTRPTNLSRFLRHHRGLQRNQFPTNLSHSRHLSATSPPPFSSPLHGRRYPSLPDILSPTPAHLLTLSLSPYLTPSTPPPTTIRTRGELNPGYYLAYFPPLWLHEKDVLPDGSDASQSPGPGGDWPRRMWAGGEVLFAKGGEAGERLMLGEGAICDEKVSSVERKGSGSGGEKVFVWFERRYFGLGREWEKAYSGEWEKYVARQPAVIEKRCLVFMKRDADGTPVASPPPPQQQPRIVKPPNKPDFSKSFIPSITLLLRFSALTFNAHKIHFDPTFCEKVESHRAPLCHGPLSQVFLLELLTGHLLEQENAINSGSNKKRFRVRRLEYRNLAPMYVDEKYTICGRLKRDKGVVDFGDGQEGVGRVYELWAETPEGGMSVKAMAVVEEVAE